MKNILIVAVIIAAFYWFRNQNKSQETTKTMDSGSPWLLTSSSLKTTAPVVNTGTSGSNSNTGTSSGTTTGTTSGSSSSGGGYSEPSEPHRNVELAAFSRSGNSKSCFK